MRDGLERADVVKVWGLRVRNGCLVTDICHSGARLVFDRIPVPFS